MSSLRDKLNAMAAAKPETKKPVQKESPPVVVREHRVPSSELHGFLDTSLAEVKACDPLFTGEAWDPRKAVLLDTETTGLSWRRRHRGF